ncbi:MAG: hypothetical protein OEY86_17210 [Nitrospira sp.]|nr:hypothetical protein [Nitrospira sp.]
MRNQLRIFVACAVMSLPLPFHAVGAVGDEGTMDDACNSADTGLQKLCQIVHDKFKVLQFSYVHLGGDFYVVPVLNTGRVAQGIYVVNVKSGGLNLFEGYGSPEHIEVLRQKDGALWINVMQSSMSRGQFWEAESLLELRSNPITKTPFLIKHMVRLVTGLSEEMQSFCSREKNIQSAECSGLGETVYLNRDDMDRLLTGARSVEGIVVQQILAAHQKALRVHKRKKFEGKHPFQFLEEAGIWRVLDVKPTAMSVDQYVRVMNDYAFFAYQAGGGRNNLAIEILDKVIGLSPGRAVAYLNMGEALEHLAKFGATEYATMPLDEQVIIEVGVSAKRYRDRYQSMRAQGR